MPSPPLPSGPAAGSPPIRVVIVEDDPQTRARLAEVVAAQPDMQLAGSAASFAEGAALIAGQPPDVLLTDIGLPDGSGLDLIRMCQSDRPEADVMVITVFGDERTVLRAIEAGATGYLLKDGRSGDIAEAIRALRRGGSPISPAIARHVLRRFSDPDGGPSPVSQPHDALEQQGPHEPHESARVRLTPKEVQVLQLLAKGFSYGEIGASLDVTVHTVTTHVKHIYRKLTVRSRGEAVFEGVQLGLIRVDRQDRSDRSVPG